MMTYPTPSEQALPHIAFQKGCADPLLTSV